MLERRRTPYRSPLLALTLVVGCMESHPLPPPDDAGVLAPDGWTPCPTGFVDDGDACIQWRDPAPGEPTTRADRVARSFDDDAPEIARGAYDPIVVTLPDGSRIAVSSDIWAHPIAWRTTPDGRWRQTVPPPSAFVHYGAVLSPDEALFFAGPELPLGATFVFVRHPR